MYDIGSTKSIFFFTQSLLLNTLTHYLVFKIVSIDNGVIATKGDHNSEQLKKGNNIFNTDETNIVNDRIIGKAVLKIPYLGWPKIWLVEGLKLIFG